MGNGDSYFHAPSASLGAPRVKVTVPAGPVKRSIMIAGHATSISLEPVFWDALRAAAEAQGLPLNALVARIDAERIAAPDPANLASAIRVWLFEREQGRWPSS
jgi:predicted DNA-binding ribbon-helix-helix protein